jgi:hypothetical protein
MVERPALVSSTIKDTLCTGNASVTKGQDRRGSVLRGMTRLTVSERSTRDVENCIGIVRVLLQSLQGLDRRKNKELDLASCCLPLKFFHHPAIFRTHQRRGPATKFLARSENKAGADSNRVRPPNLPRRIDRYVRGLPCFLVSLPLLQFGPCHPKCPIQRSLRGPFTSAWAGAHSISADQPRSIVSAVTQLSARGVKRITRTARHFVTAYGLTSFMP